MKTHKILQVLGMFQTLIKKNNYNKENYNFVVLMINIYIKNLF